jgi:hypothetical protein
MPVRPAASIAARKSSSASFGVCSYQTSTGHLPGRTRAASFCPRKRGLAASRRRLAARYPSPGLQCLGDTALVARYHVNSPGARGIEPAGGGLGSDSSRVQNSSSQRPRNSAWAVEARRIADRAMTMASLIAERSCVRLPGGPWDSSSSAGSSRLISFSRRGHVVRSSRLSLLRRTKRKRDRSDQPGVRLGTERNRKRIMLTCRQLVVQPWPGTPKQASIQKPFSRP